MDRSALKAAMLELAKAIHRAIGIESPYLFIGTFALLGALLFGGLAWIVDRGYRVSVREEAVDKPKQPEVHIEQHNEGSTGTNIAAQTINLGRPNRALNGEQQANLASLLSAFRGQSVGMSMRDGDDEAEGFADNLISALALAKISVDDRDRAVGLSAGITLAFGKNRAGLATQLNRALIASGSLARPPVMAPVPDENALSILVGSNPSR